LTEWAAYYQLDPFGSYRSDLQAAIGASVTANIHAKKGHRFTPADFIPTFNEPTRTKTMSPAEIHARLSLKMKRPM
jgi:hypothetical protein